LREPFCFEFPRYQAKGKTNAQKKALPRGGRMKKYLRNLFTHTLSAKIAGTAMLAIALAAPSFAVPPKQLLRHDDTRTITGNCCFGWGEAVAVTLGATPVPVVVDWSADFANAGRFLVSISVNGGPCGAAGGPGQVPDFLAPNGYNNINFHWIVFPTDGLLPGANIIELCGGAHPQFNSGGSASLGFRNLIVRKGN